MIFGMTLYQVLCYFLIYSFLGWVTEVVYHAVTLGKVINRGFLNGPLCPVYGFGVLAVFSMLNGIESSGYELGDFMVFVFGVVLATSVELIAGWLLDVCFHARWWDYSNDPLNFHGYICLGFSIVWGLAILFVVRVFHKNIDKFINLIPENAGWVIIIVMMVVFAADIAVTVAIVLGFNKKLKQLDKLKADMRIVSDKLSDKLGTATIDTAQKVEEGQVQAALAKAELRDSAQETIEELNARKAALTTRFEELSDSITSRARFGQGHILKAFPNMKHKTNPEIVSMLKERMMKK